MSELQQLLNQLHLQGLLAALNDTAEQYSEQTLNQLTTLLKAEAVYRQTRSFMYRLNLAKLPQIKTLDNFDITPTQINQDKLNQLTTCQFINAHENVLLIGSSGTGKSHIALALAYKALQQQHRIRFYRFNELAKHLIAALEQNRENQVIAQLKRYSLLVIDELGYLPINPKARGLLFELFSQFYEYGSLIITTHLAFDEWAELFGNNKATKAIIDRLTHHCHLLETGNESWRLKEAMIDEK